MIIGQEGFIARFYSVFYNNLRNVCKNYIVKIIVHLLGGFFILIGFYLFIYKIPSLISIFGVFTLLFGIVIFVTPFGIED